MDGGKQLGAFRVVVERQFVPGDVLEILKQQPIKLPPWDPMFTPED